MHNFSVIYSLYEQINFLKCNSTSKLYIFNAWKNIQLLSGQRSYNFCLDLGAVL